MVNKKDLYCNQKSTIVHVFESIVGDFLQCPGQCFELRRRGFVAIEQIETLVCGRSCAQVNVGHKAMSIQFPELKQSIGFVDALSGWHVIRGRSRNVNQKKVRNASVCCMIITN